LKQLRLRSKFPRAPKARGTSRTLRTNPHRNAAKPAQDEPKAEPATSERKPRPLKTKTVSDEDEILAEAFGQKKTEEADEKPASEKKPDSEEEARQAKS
jgi:hypothetical protein